MPNANPPLPWEQSSPVKGNLAIGNLRENLVLLLKSPKGVHMETLLATTGAIAGFSSQQAMWIETGWNPERPPAGLGDDLIVSTTGAGERLFFGDRINGYLTGDSRAPSRPYLWGYVRGALQALGLDAAQHPDARTLYSNVSKSVGGKAFGFPTVPDPHRINLPVPQLLRLVWPHVSNIFTLKPPQSLTLNEPDLDERDWPFVAFLVARQFLLKTEGLVPPEIAAVLVMESAIIASKLDPSGVPRQRLVRRAG